MTAKCIGIDDKRRLKMSIKAAIRDGKGSAPKQDAPKKSQNDDVPDNEETFTLG